MLTLFFNKKRVNDFKTAVKSNTDLFGKYFNEMLTRGIYLPPSQFEALFISTAHSQEDLDKTIEVNLESLKSL
jgi:glutamate-1-semialdehyde 2,1-aminomutase